MATSTTDHAETPMTETVMDLSELLTKRDQGGFLRSIAEVSFNWSRRPMSKA